MKSLQADFFKVMKEGAIQYAAPLPFLDLVCVGTATQTEGEGQGGFVDNPSCIP